METVAAVNEGYPKTAEALVVIAASAGGVEATRTVLQGLPANLPAAVVVVQHRAAARPWYLDRVLQRYTGLPVRWVEEDMPLASGIVYLAPPDRHLRVTRDRLISPSDGRRIRFLLSSANPLFESAAEAYGARAIGVVLTGGGTDATDGVQAIASRGGIVIAQDENTSAHFSMPRSAIGTGAVNRVLPLEQIAPTIVELLTRSPDTAVGPDGGVRVISDG